MESYFSTWHRWSDRNSYSGVDYPGIYVVAISSRNLSGNEFSYLKEIVYVGMTNAVSGLKGRLAQFDNTIAMRHCQHGGADRVLYKHQSYKKLVKSLYVSMRHWKCNPASLTPRDLRAMGKVAAAEYELFARCIENLENLPEFNRKKESKKYSLTYGRG